MTTFNLQSVPVPSSVETYTVTIDAVSFSFAESVPLNVTLSGSALSIDRTGAFTQFSETLAECRTYLLSSGAVRSYAAISPSDHIFLLVVTLWILAIAYVFRRA